MKQLVILCLVLSWANSDSTRLLIEKINSKATWKATSYPKSVTPSLGFLGVHPDPNFKLPVKKHKIGRSTIPTSFDAREKWPQCKDVINNIRNQGKCGSCWAFAATEVLSDRLCIQTNGEKKIELSPQNLLSCCEYCGYGCGGGFSAYAWGYFNHAGVVSGGDYNTTRGCQPYESLAFFNNTTPSCKTSCTNPTYTTLYLDDKNHGYSYYTATNDVQQIQMEIMTNGPVQASYVVYDDFPHYGAGVYHYIIGEKQGNHAVKIIGWGVENNISYWLVANSWGSDWGLQGYFKIRRGNNECGIEAKIIAGNATLKVNNDDNDDDSSAVRNVAVSFGMVLGAVIFFCLY